MRSPAQEDGVKVATRGKMEEAKAKLEKVAANLSTKELQELQKDRIEACAARIENYKMILKIMHNWCVSWPPSTETGC